MDLNETYQRALTYLGRRDHSRTELSRKLHRVGASADIIETVLERLIETGYQDDARFAEAYTVYRARRGFGPLRIQQELMERGVEQSLIINAIANDDFDWSALTMTAWQKKFKNTVSTAPAARAKQWRFLMYRGFLPEDCAFLRR